MKKKIVVFLILVTSLIGSAILIYDRYFPSPHLGKIGMGSRIIVWILTIILLVYYRNSISKPQLVPSVLTNEKESSREKK